MHFPIIINQHFTVFKGSTRSPFSYSLSDQLGPFLATFELARRCMWGMFKMEFEHVTAGSKGEIISLHLEMSQSASKDSNQGMKEIVFHLVAGLGALTMAALIAAMIISGIVYH
jgi:hypothetical protein